MFLCAELGPDEEQGENVKNPREDVKAGLQDSSGLQLPLQSIHVKCKLIDLLSQVRCWSLICAVMLELSSELRLLRLLTGHRFPKIH